MKLAPIVLFVYNRPKHTIQTLEALERNELADQSDLIIYSDSAKTTKEENLVKQVREICQSKKGFKSVRLVKRVQNFGLAKSITQGVDEVVQAHGKAIILEDDIVTAPSFLKFMNQALQAYENKPKVWHISGWNYPIETEGMPDVFFWRGMNCWGWATWADRWAHYRKEPKRLVKEFSKAEKRAFSLDGKLDFWQQIVANYKGKLDTWAIFWSATIFENKGLCLNPTQTLVLNIGTDGSGEHGGDLEGLYNSTLSTKKTFNFPNTFEEDQEAIKRIKTFSDSLRKPLTTRIKNKLTKLLKS